MALVELVPDHCNHLAGTDFLELGWQSSAAVCSSPWPARTSPELDHQCDDAALQTAPPHPESFLQGQLTRSTSQ